MWLISPSWSSDTQKSKKCSAQFLMYTSFYCKACVIFSVLQDLQWKESHTIQNRCTYRAINTLHLQCNGWGFLCYIQHLLKSGCHISQFFTPVLSEGLGDGAAMAKPCLTYCPRPSEPSCSSACQQCEHHTTLPSFFFFIFQTRLNKLQNSTDADYTSFFISIPYIIPVCFSWDSLSSQPSTKHSFHFADTLVNLFYFNSKTPLKVLGIIAK